MSSLYIHIPFCLQKCNYCDFFSQAPAGPEALIEYSRLLQLEARQLKANQANTGPLQTIFFGGGTPSLLSAEQIADLLAQLEEGFGFSANCEISLEANPGSISREKLTGYRKAGVNRLSLGIQSLNDQHLQLLGRIHSAAEARQAVQAAREAGFDNISLDLIFALPRQSIDQLQTDVEELLALDPQHLALYGLTSEPGTLLDKQLKAGELQEADEQFYANSYLLIDQLLNAAGFEHYEISNFARPGYRCRHNQAYWHRQTSLALGCGAHSFIDNGWGERWHVPADLDRYRAKILAEEPAATLLEVFDRQGAMSETLYLTLRTRDGLSKEYFSSIFGVTPETVFAAAFDRCSGYLREQDRHWRFNLQGWLLYDHLISAFL